MIFNACRNPTPVRTDRYKLIHYPKIGRNQLFDLKDDPYETKDLIDDENKPVKEPQLAKKGSN